MGQVTLLTSEQEARLLGECFALLLADIRRNREARLAQSGPKGNVYSNKLSDKA